MPPLEVNQSTHISASVRLDESTAEQVSQYAAFIHTFEADVAGKVVNSCLRERPRLPNALEALQVEQAASMLRFIRGTNQYAKDAARASGEGVCIRCAGGMFCVRSDCIGTTFNIRCEASAVLRTGRNVDTSPPSWELRSARRRFDVYAG
jgi:hypothetical protein